MPWSRRRKARAFLVGGVLVVIGCTVLTFEVLDAVAKSMRDLAEFSVNHVLSQMETHLATLQQVDVRVYRDPSGVVEISGGAVPGGVSVGSMDAFAAVVAELRGPGTAIVAVGYETETQGPLAMLLESAPPDVEEARADLLRILAENGFH